MCEKKVLGVKSYKFILLEFVGFVAGTILSILLIYAYLRHSKTYCLLLSIISFVCALAACYFIIRTLIRPKNMVEYDDKGVYIHFGYNKTVFVLFSEITNVFSIPVSGGHGMIYRFGTLYIHTKTNQYKIGTMNDVEDVEQFVRSHMTYKSKYYR